MSEGTVNITYNPIKQEVITQKKHSVRDNDIEKIRFVFIDIDPKRKEGSATDSERKGRKCYGTSRTLFERKENRIICKS